MAPNEDEEELLRSVALQNARSVLLARQRAEEALRQSEERYRALTRANTSVVWTTDAEGRFVTAQPSWSAYTGQTWEELRDFGWANAFHPDDRERVRSLWEAARAARTLYQSDGRVWHAASRSYRHFEARAVPVLNSDGSVREWVGECLDVEDRKQAEAASALLAAIVASSDDAIITKNLDGVITSWNKSAERLFGYAEQEAVGRSVTMLIPPDRLNEEPQILDRLRCGERVDHFETIRVRKDGGTLDVSLTISPVKDAAGRIVGISKIARDITERKRAEVALREADRHKNEFLAMLAHELRNPLAPIRNALQIMRMTGRNGEAVTSASEMMERQVGQMVRLVDDLLDVSRISRGKIELRRGRIELASAVNHAVEAARALYESMNHELTVALPAQPIYLNADPTRLAQVVGNLLNNACKFTDKGGRISLTVEREGTQAVIRVRDTGIGIAAEQLPRIFDMFVQVDTSLERSVSGLGIGLTLVKNLVEMHDGTIEVHSAGVGHGSEFVVRLPILVETADPPPEPTVGEPSPTTARRILVVDDNRDSATSLAMLLKLTGNETHTAYDGLEAVEAASAFKPDVVLLDIGLPRLNGYEACRRIREQPWGKGIMFVALTGWGQEEDRQMSREAGFNAHMVKPVELDALMKLFASLFPKEERQLTKR